MILADKILALRKENGWSQEELADKLNVSRQSVSKWESAASIPDINKILEMSKLFGVTTDYLLKDDQAVAVYAEGETGARKVLLAEANDYLAAIKTWRKKLALGVALCILSPIPLLLLAGMSDNGTFGVTGALAAGLGVVILLLAVATAVAVFITGSMPLRRFDSMLKDGFELEYGVEGILRERRVESERGYQYSIVLGVILCILSPVPLILGGVYNMESAVAWVCLVSLLLVMVACAVVLFILSVTLRSSFDRLLGEGEYNVAVLEETRRANRLGGFYWPLITAVYLGWSFISNDWHITWAIWPVAALIFVCINVLIKNER